MKLKQTMLVLLPLTSLVLSGCDTIGQSVLMNALEDAKSGDLRTFQSHFEGKALSEFGTPEGMARLQSLAGRWETFTANETLVQEYLADGRHNRVYREEIFGQNGQSEPVLIGTVDVHCSNVRIWFCAISQISDTRLIDVGR